MRRSSHNDKSSHLRVQQQREPVSQMKSIVVEKADIGGLTLMFQDRMVEISWQQNQLKRNFGISVRFLFFSSLFQGLFLWSDLIEQGEYVGNESYPQLNFLCLRLLLGGFSLLSCFLVSTGLLLPTQMNIFWVNMVYALPSIAIYYLTRERLSHWDSLYIVYGLCFFMLPKISPLNFIFGFAGSALLTVLFIYISAFRLSLNEWLLSNTLLLVLFPLFMYVSYSFEKSSRERWMLRERLKRERINLDLVASSIHDDFKKTTHDKLSFPLDEIQRETYAQQIRITGNQPFQSDGIMSAAVEDGASTSDEDDKLSKTRRKSMNQFFKGLGAWGLLLLMGNAFEVVYKPITTIQGHEVDSSATSALLMHSMGFSVFLLYFTGQIRWLILNGVVGLIMLWIFNMTGIENKWVIVSTHSVGYIVLATTVVIMILVFGGVVLVWSNLIDFLKDILVRYPQVKDDLSQKKILEQVLIRYISSIPKTEVLHSRVAGSMDGDDNCDVEVANYEHERSRAHARAGFMKKGKCFDDIGDESMSTEFIPSKKKGKLQNGHSKVTTQFDEGGDLMLEVMSCKRPSHCFFCLTATPSYLIPACDAWNPKEKSDPIPMCTPYTQLAFDRDELTLTVQTQKAEISRQREDLEEMKNILRTKEETITGLQSKYNNLESQFTRSRKNLEDQLASEQALREMEVQSVISQHNAQLAELKRIHKAFHARQLQAMQQIRDQNRAYAAGESLEEEHESTEGIAKAGGRSTSSGTARHDQKSSNKDKIKDTTNNTGGGVGGYRGESSSSKLDAKAILLSRHSTNPSSSTSSSSSSTSSTATTTSSSSYLKGKVDSSTKMGSSECVSARSLGFEGSLESVSSINDMEDLSKFFKASMEEIELLLSTSNSSLLRDKDCAEDESSTTLFTTQNGEGNTNAGTNRMKYAMFW